MTEFYSMTEFTVTIKKNHSLPQYIDSPAEVIVRQNISSNLIEAAISCHYLNVFKRIGIQSLPQCLGNARSATSTRYCRRYLMACVHIGAMVCLKVYNLAGSQLKQENNIVPMYLTCHYLIACRCYVITEYS